MDRRILGIACVVGAVTVLVLQDALIKWLSGDYALHEIVLVRAASAICVTLFVMRLEGGIHLLRTRRLGLHLVRTGLLIVANSAFFLALAAMTIAEATSILYVAPVLITAFSALLLHETVGPRRWAAVCVGLAGVIVMLRPGEDALRLVALLPIVAAAAYALMQIVTRRLGTTERASTIAFYAQAGFVAASVAIGLVAGHGRFAPEDNASLAFLLRAWTVPSVPDAALFVAIGVINGVGGYLMSQAYRITRPSVLAPFEYVALPMAVIWGVVFFADWPGPITYAGMALICGSGLYVLHRETVVARARRAADRSAG
ncbi:MAG: DMT family transporter [Gammaproteobacteria bacterium]|nr:DMT family transporter [Gammaproteobacteria bacterium]